jgi:hypothetical protein
MSNSALAELQSLCPVKGSIYDKTLAVAIKIDKRSVAKFMTQWYAFSSTVPEILCIAAMKASCEAERANIVANLYSELGLDADGTSHPALLKDLIEQATGQTPSPDLVTIETRDFLVRLKDMMLAGSSPYNAGVMLAMEAVAYSILAVLKEILEKGGNLSLTAHPYITIHEEVEATHIENTEQNIELYKAQIGEINMGYAEMLCKWQLFWNDAFTTLVAHDA